MSQSCSTLPPLPAGQVINSKNEKKNENPKKMEITIHVCDEAKNLKKDFTCPKSLLLEEMRYFRDYLSSDNQTWEDIDISVHCDVKIFDWLIRYVKRDKENSDSGPILNGKSAVSILISSEFLKMSKLVDECIEFCHDHMSEIIASPCNMNCINEPLVKRIASTFTQHDLERVVDRKDKFKSKLFCKKIEEMFDPGFSSIYSPNNASSLYMCMYCRKLLLRSVEKYVECTVARTFIDPRGNLQYIHFKDDSWDVQEYLSKLKQLYKTWRCVFWKLWSDVNFLECNRCREIFPLSQYNNCRYHPDEAVSSEFGSRSVYPCCNQEMFLFEPISSKSGCKHREHEVSLEMRSQNEQMPWLNSSQEVFDELTATQIVSLVCEDGDRSTQDQATAFSLDCMIKTELLWLNKNNSVTSKEEKRDKKRPSSNRHHRVPHLKNRNKTGFPIRKK